MLMAANITELKLEPMNREQRKFTHHVAGRLDLKSHSTGLAFSPDIFW